MKPPTPPKTLTPAARRLWTSIHAEYAIDDAPGIATLTSACESWDRAAQARELIDQYGPMLFDRFKQAKLNPMVVVERDSRAAWLAALKQLGLETDAKPVKMGRPSGGLTARSSFG